MTTDPDDDALRAAEVRSAESAPRPIEYKNGFPVFAARPGAKPITPEHIAAIQEQIDREDCERACGYFRDSE